LSTGQTIQEIWLPQFCKSDLGLTLTFSADLKNPTSSPLASATSTNKSSVGFPTELDIMLTSYTTEKRTQGQIEVVSEKISPNFTIFSLKIFDFSEFFPTFLYLV